MICTRNNLCNNPPGNRYNDTDTFAAISPGKALIVPIIRNVPFFLTLETSSIYAIEVKKAVMGMLASVPIRVNPAARQPQRK